MKNKKKFASIVATILAISCMFSSVPVEAGDAEIFHDESAEGQTNLALNCEYSGDYLDNIGSNYPDSGFKELTDGDVYKRQGGKRISRRRTEQSEQLEEGYGGRTYRNHRFDERKP